MIKNKEQKQSQGQKQRVKTKSKSRQPTKLFRIGYCPCSPDVGDCPRCHVQPAKSIRKTRKNRLSV